MTQRNLVVYWLNPPQNTQAIYPDLAWMNFSSAARDYTWVRPIIDWESYTTIEAVVAEVLSHSPDVLCVSTYVWNYNLCYAVAAEVKRVRPEITVVQGGPHQGFSNRFFDDHPYIDYACYATGHGEYFIVELLSQLSRFGRVVYPDQIPYLISRTYFDPTLNRKYVYPEISSLEYQVEYIMECAGVSQSRKVPLTLMLETTRGCPYSCTYCEWGGGTSSKVSAKPMSTIIRELDLIGSIGIQGLDIIDANFGILERDLEVAKYIAHVKACTNHPTSVTVYGVAKTSVSKRERILDVLYQHRLMSTYFVAFQSMSTEALRIVKRTDITFEDNIALAHRMVAKYGAEPHVELMLGLPGSTIDDFYAEMDLYHQFYANGDRSGWYKARNLFTLLPDTPAADPGYMAVNGMRAIPAGVMDGEESIDDLHSSNSIITSYRGSAQIVIQAFSFTTNQWTEMFMLNRIQRTVGPLLKPSTKASTFFREFWELLKTSPYYRVLDQHATLLVSGELSGSDMISVGGMRIEDHVLRYYVLPNKQSLSKSLDFTSIAS